MTTALVIIACLALAGTAVGFSLTIVPQSYVYVTERMRHFHKELKTGIHWKLPFIDRVARKITDMEQLADFPPWQAITKDNVSVLVDTVVFFQVVDTMLFSYGAEEPLLGIQNLATAIVRNIIGSIEFGDILASRNVINATALQELHKATHPWGVRFNRVELQEMRPAAKDVQDAMDKQLMAKIEKEQKILQAEGEAESILAVQRARAQAIELINKAAPGNEYLQLQAMEAFAKAADGKATKIVIPSDMQGMAGLAGLAQGMTDAMLGD